MEIQEDKVAFLATKITFNVETKDLVLNRDNTIIKEEDYNIILDQKTEEFFIKIGKKMNDRN